MAIYLTSDLHFGHNKDFLYGPRGFESIEEHDKKVIENWNSIVTDEDEVYILGDLMLNDNEAGIEKLNQLNGKIYFIIGNHDTAARIDLYEMNGLICLGYAHLMKYKKMHFFLSHYPTLTANLEGEKFSQRIHNFFGHTHQPVNFWKDNESMYHVGMDSHDCKPVLIDDAIAEMKEKFKEHIELVKVE